MATGAGLEQHSPMLMAGEVRTALLLSRDALPAEAARQVLALVPGEPVRSRERPIRFAWSPDLLTGVDCQAPTPRRVRLVGTAVSRVSLTGGQIVQSSTWAAFRPGPAGRRRSWSHYLAHPGTVELLGATRPADLSTGFLAGPRAGVTIDLGAVNDRLLAVVQGRIIDKSPPFRAARTVLRWTAQGPTDGSEHARLTIDDDGLRTLRIVTSVVDPRAIEEMCADLARHDWLLTSLVALADRAVGAASAAERVQRLRPAMDRLVPAWMPGIRVPDELRTLWLKLESRSAWSLQWQKTVERIRDEVSLSMVEGLHALDRADRGHHETLSIDRHEDLPRPRRGFLRVVGDLIRGEESPQRQ